MVLFGLGNSSDAFLLLQAQSAGLTAVNLLLMYALFNVTEAIFGYYAGRMSDRIGRRPLMAAGFLVFGIVYLGFGIFKNEKILYALFAVYGIYYTLTQGSQRALAADLAHPNRRGAEIGLYHFIVGVTALPSSLLAGFLYQRVGTAAPFILGAGTAILSALLIVLPPPGATPAKRQSIRMGFQTDSKPPS